MENASKRNPFPRRPLIYLLVALFAFLLGFVPQFQTARTLRRQLAATAEENSRLKSRLEFASLQDSLVDCLLATADKNYGIAARHSTTFFDRIQNLATGEVSPERHELYRQILASRDPLTTRLGAADQAAMGDLLRILQLLRAASPQ